MVAGYNIITVPIAGRTSLRNRMMAGSSLPEIPGNKIASVGGKTEVAEEDGIEQSKIVEKVFTTNVAIFSRNL